MFIESAKKNATSVFELKEVFSEREQLTSLQYVSLQLLLSVLLGSQTFEVEIDSFE